MKALALHPFDIHTIEALLPFKQQSPEYYDIKFNKIFNIELIEE